MADSLAALEEQFFGATIDEDRSSADEVEGPVAAEPPPEPAPPVAAAPPSPSAPLPAAPPPPVAKPPEPATLVALADRALESDPLAAAAACAALENRRRDPSVRPAAEKLRRALLSGISARARRAAHAIGALRDVEAIPLLIQVLETSEPETTREAADALAGITMQRLGPDARRWLAWWKENRGRGRAEWLFSGLTSADRETRVAASVELSLASPPPVAYSADMPAADREKAARIFRNSAEKLASFDQRGSLLVGDVDPVDVVERAGAYTPVPGGVGPLTIAMLMANTVAAAERRARLG